MVTGVTFCSTETGSQRVGVMMTDSKVSRRLSVSMAPGATGFDHSMLRQLNDYRHHTGTYRLK